MIGAAYGRFFGGGQLCVMLDDPWPFRGIQFSTFPPHYMGVTFC